MAFAKSVEVKESQPFSKYIGAVIAHLEAVNPTAEELKKITGRDMQVSDYVTNVEVVDLNNQKKEGKQNALSLWFRLVTNDQKNPDEKVEPIIVNKRIYLSNSARIGSNSGKIQVVDKYGRFAWVTKEEYDAKAIPVYKNGPASISSDYRAAIVGEEELIEAMKAFLGMNNPSERMSDGTYRNLTEDELKQRESEFACYLEPEDIKKIMSGNVSMLKSALEGCNDVKLILGVKHTDKGDYQAVYGIYKKNYSNLSKIEEQIKAANLRYDYFSDGHIPNGLVEWKVSPTDNVKSKASLGSEDKPVDDLPF